MRVFVYKPCFCYSKRKTKEPFVSPVMPAILWLVYFRKTIGDVTEIFTINHTKSDGPCFVVYN